MKLTVLVDNNTLIDRYFAAEPGLSLFIEESGRRILFDCGYSGIFLDNARRMGIDLLFLDHLVFSHGHLDHTWGVEPLIREFSRAVLENRPCQKPVVTAHPKTFKSTFFKGVGEIGSLISKEKLENHFRFHPAEKPVGLTERLTFLGEIPRKNDFEALVPLGRKEGENGEDFIPEDTALVYRSDDGLVIITGCSHAGICNIVEYARTVCREERILDIIGGLHLQDPPAEQMKGTTGYLGALGLRHLYACHCTDLKSKIELSGVVPIRETGVGLSLEY